MKYLIFFLCLLSFSAYSALLTWTAPTEREDNTALLQSEIQGYKIFCYQKGSPNFEQSVGNITAVDITPPEGRWVCNMITIDTEDRYSGRSNNTSFAITIPSPKPPVMQ